MLTKERLTEMLSFNADEGRFYWSAPVRGIRVGMQAGSYDAHGYGQIRIDRRIYKEHHLVWLWMTGLMPKGAGWFFGFSRRPKEIAGEPRLVSYAPDGETCTLNFDGEEHYYDRTGTTANAKVSGERSESAGLTG